MRHGNSDGVLMISSKIKSPQIQRHIRYIKTIRYMKAKGKVRLYFS